MSLHKGEPWGAPARGPHDVEVRGDDRSLATAVGTDRLVWFRPEGSDLARAVGLDTPVRTDTPGDTELVVDAIAVDRSFSGTPGTAATARVAVNMAVVGTPPDRLRWWSGSPPLEVRVDGRTVFSGRATTVVIANGQFLRAADLVPRGHPGDGRIEVQVYTLPRGERRPMRARLHVGDHVPHPRILERRARSIGVTSRHGRVPLEVDGRVTGRVEQVSFDVVPAALRLLV